MKLERPKKFTRSIALLTLLTFSGAPVPVRVAHAKPAERELPSGEAAPIESKANADIALDTETEEPAKAAERMPEKSSATDAVGHPEVLEPEVAQPAEPRSLPTGGDKSGITNQAISLPKGSGTIEGMGESFSTQLSTGVATFNLPIGLLPARGGAQPALSLSYSSSSGLGIAGMGWQLGAPFIARQTDRKVPGYDDRANWHAEQDRFVFNGGQELVPICVVAAGLACTGALRNISTPSGRVNEAMPAWATGWQYFRPRVEGSFLRFFWSPDHKTWRVQDKSGSSMELGVPLDGSGNDKALERNPDRPSEIYRWHLVRQYDAHGDANPATANPRPVNVVVYKYFQDGGMAYLSDIFDTTPAADLLTLDTSKYAHHTHLDYETRTDPTTSFRSGWAIEQRLRLRSIDVTSKTFSGAITTARRSVRRYRLEYEAGQHVSLLASVAVEGRCSAAEGSTTAEATTTQLLPDTDCARLPAMRFGYQHVTPLLADGGPGNADLAGYEGFDERTRTLEGSPRHSIDEEHTALLDVNADGLLDVLFTEPGRYGSGHGVFFNGAQGPDSFGAATPIAIDSGITFRNLNVVPLDLDGDGTPNLLHMPFAKRYTVYAPRQTAGEWEWLGRNVTIAQDQSPKIDFGKDAAETRIADVNGDGLVDIIFSAGKELQTFFALGRYPGGDGQFGHASLTSASSADLSNDPLTGCLPVAGSPIRFSDPEVKLADMNGDGMVDLVRLLRGDVRYWPGRGNGFWGTGSRDDCPSGFMSDVRYVAMAESPAYSDFSGQTVRVEDVNGDGLADLVQIRSSEVDVWLNVDGSGFTDRHIIKNTPANPAYANRVVLTDINGSGTADILWGNAGDYRYIDLAGGVRPWVLTRIENGLGKVTALEYSTSAAEMLAAEAESSAVEGRGPWSKKMPMSVHVVKRTTDYDGLEAVGRARGAYVTEYRYRDPVYEGRQREFRGFSQAEVRRLGDANSPTDVTRTNFLLGECVDLDPGSAVDTCDAEHRYLDNTREALKGLPALVESFDETGVYLSTAHTTYTLRHLYTGLDGRAVRHAFERAKDEYRYDTAPFVPRLTPVTTIDDATVEGATEPDENHPFSLRSNTGRVRVNSAVTVDQFGNKTQTIARGCFQGCSPGDEVITTFTDPARPSGDGSGWLWRTVRSYTTGSQHTGNWKESRTTYNAAGDPVDAFVTLSGSIPLDRTNAAGVAGASAPLDASADGEIQTSHSDYDAAGLGLLVHQSGPNGHCVDFGYDTQYQQLTTSETASVGGTPPFGFGQCGPRTLVTGAAYDRGLGKLTVMVDPNLQSTLVGYDALGRQSAMARPVADGTVPTLSKPSVKISYMLADKVGKPYSVLRTQTEDGLAAPGFIDQWTFIDGLGRTLMTLHESEKVNRWIVSGFTVFDAKGGQQQAHLEYFFQGALTEKPATGNFTGSPPVGSAPPPYRSQRYDAFSRVIQTKDLDGTVTLENKYHALAADHSDAADLASAEPTPATERKDGHGRTSVTIERIHVGPIEERSVTIEYLPTGEPEVVTRQRGTDSVVRWMRYDSLGRMVLNVEPNATANFNPDPAAVLPAVVTYNPTALKAWRYSYNNAGDLVGTSEARGCGTNFFYDSASRLIGEDYSPCSTEHAPYSGTTIATGDGVEVAYYYDLVPLDSNGIAAPPSTNTGDDPAYVASYPKGHLLAVSDRGASRWSQFDARGRVTLTATRIARPDAPPNGFANRYAPRWYYQSTGYDVADREVWVTSGAKVPELFGTVFPATATSVYNNSAVATTYTTRGTVQDVAGSYGPLVTLIDRAPDGLINQVKYGDLATTTTDFGYDSRRRLSSVMTSRGPPPSWSSPPANYLPAPNLDPASPTTFQLLLRDEDIFYDVVNNPIEIHDWRTAAEWPAGAKPVTRKFKYDDLNRLARVDHLYPSADDEWTSPFDAENTGSTDPRRGRPAPHVDFAKRTLFQTFEYDWLGNTSRSDDDAGGFYDRSLGAINNSTTAPYQLASATNTSVTGATSIGQLTTFYDAAGNLERLSVERRGTCLPAGAKCSQRYGYTWDEVGRLVRARRWDFTVAALQPASAPLPGTTPQVDLKYAYDASDARVLKTATESGASRSTLYIFDMLELRRASFAAVGGNPADYERSAFTEVPYLLANGVRIGRLVNEDPTVPSIGGARLHVLLELTDQLGSNSIVIDKATGELAERMSYHAYGGTESDYRPARWEGFREDYRFTGKEEDIEVGLLYFGNRYYAPPLNRWISADPLTVHVAQQADLNLYAYVRGQSLKAVDPLGLDEAQQMSLPEEDPGAAMTHASVPSGAPNSSTTPPPPRAQPKVAPRSDAAGPSLLPTAVASLLVEGTSGPLNLWHAEANSRPDAGVAPTELPPGGLDWSGGAEGGCLSDPAWRTAAGLTGDMVLSEVVMQGLLRQAPAPAADPRPLLLPAPEMRNPWLPGAELQSYPAGPNTTINMAMSPGQVRPGGWGTFEKIPNVDFARNDLAIIPEFKPEISHVQQFRVPEGTMIQVGPVGPQVSGGVVYPGGASQVQILNLPDRAKLVPVGDPVPIY